MGLPRWRGGKESACLCRRCKRCGFNPWVGKIPWSRKWQPTPLFLSGNFHGQKNLAGCSPWGRKESRHDWAGTHTCNVHSSHCIFILWNCFISDTSPTVSSEPQYLNVFPLKIQTWGISLLVIWKSYQLNKISGSELGLVQEEKMNLLTRSPKFHAFHLTVLSQTCDMV